MSEQRPDEPPRITLKQVAEAAGVSLATASYSLNDGGSVGQQTRERVKSVAQQLGYQPNASAKAMRTGRIGALGLVLPDLTNPFFPQLAQTVIAAARDAGFHVFLTDTLGSKETERQSIDALVRRGIDGLVWFPIDDRMPDLPDLRTTPTVVLDRALDGFDCVLADCEAGGRIAAAMLLRAGHRRFGMVSGPSAASSARQRAAGTRDALKRAGAELVWEVEAAFSSDLDADIVQALARRDVTAVVAGADLIAIGVVRQLGRLGIRVPQDVSVVGFDNIAWSDLCSPALSTIDMPIHEMGMEAMQMLQRRIAAPHEPRRRVVFDVTAVERASIAAPVSAAS